MAPVRAFIAEQHRPRGASPVDPTKLQVPDYNVQCVTVISSSNPPYQGQDFGFWPCSGSSSSLASLMVPQTSGHTTTRQPLLSTAIPPGTGCVSVCDDNIPAISNSVQGIRGPSFSFNYSKINLSVNSGPSEAESMTCASSLYALIYDITFSSNYKTKTIDKTLDNFTVGIAKPHIAGLTAASALELHYLTGLRSDNDEKIPKIVLTETKEQDVGHSKEEIRAELKPNDVMNRSNMEANSSNDTLTSENTQTIKQDMKKLWVAAIGGRYNGPASNAGWGIPVGLGLRGGGETSLNAGTSGWGTPPAAGGQGWGGNPPGAPQNQWGAARPPGQPATNTNQAQGAEFNQNKSQPGNQQQNPNNTPQQAAAGAGVAPAAGAAAGTQGPQGQPGGAQGQPNTSWAQAAGKGLPTQSTSQAAAPSSTTTKQMEQLNTMREALFSQDGWGGQHVNQDSPWDMPQSPEPGPKADASQAAGSGSGPANQGASQAPMWKQNVNNGTELWEANLRNGGQPPPQPQSKTPWGHTPSNNIGGTWGEEDEQADSSNMWTGVPSGNSAHTTAPWAGNSTGWTGGPSDKKDWPGAVPGGTAGAAAWGDLRPPIDPRMDPRDAINRDMLPLPDSLMRNMRNSDGGVMRGDPRGVSGRLNNTSEMWAAHQQQQQQAQQQAQQAQQNPKMGPNMPPGNQWAGSGLPKDMVGMPGNPAKPSGWEEPSPPAQRRNIPNFDDGTSLWGQQHARTGGQMGRGNMACPPGMPQTRMPGAMKPDNPVWGHPGARNGAWDSHEGPPMGSGWGEENKSGPGGAGNWGGDSPLTPPSWPGGPKSKGPAGWGDDSVDASWSHPSMQRPLPKQLTKEQIWSSKQFRILTDMSFKKEDVENALRLSNMNMQDALEMLAGRMPDWNRRQEEHSFDQGGAGAAYRAFNPSQQVGFNPGGPGSVGNNASAAAAGLLNNPNIALNSMKLLGQPGGQQGNAGQRPSGGGSQPSPQQLKMLVQQIQMAVQAGYLNHQILSQPLAPQTLMLLNQLLQQIKIMHQLQQNILNISGGPLGKNNAAIQLSVQINKIKQNISNYQNQIATQQATFMKQQGHTMPQGDSPVDMFKSNMADPLSAMQANFSDLSVNKETSSVPSFQSQQQSRLNQWKLPSVDKEGEGNEFSRAPGTTPGTKPSLPQSHSSPNMNPLLGQTDGTWSTVSRSSSDTGWPDSTTAEMTPDSKDAQWGSSQQGNSAFADIIPEFEPGKPWKGTQIKSVEEDPSITPGSVARSPLSLATIKDTEILTGTSKNSPTSSTATVDSLPALGLSSSPWSFNSSSSSVYTSPLSKLTSSKAWGDVPQGQSELWSMPGAGNKGARGPPPGLSSKAPQGWTGSGSATGAGSRASWGSSGGWGSAWLLLRNLTPQIDGSTLKTLCLQHGPLHNFHLYLNHGIALAKYSSREEANKAQTALNSCVLGNTTIFAESPGEPDVITMLNSLGHGQPQSGPQASAQNWNLRSQTKQSGVGDTWSASSSSSTLWQPTPSGSTLWGSEGDSHRTTPSASLNSFLPPDLLNGESM